MPTVPCEKCGHPHPTAGIGDGEIAAVLRERDAALARGAELEALNRDYQAETERCFDLAQRMDAMNPDAPGAFTGTPSERLTRAFERLTK